MIRGLLWLPLLAVFCWLAWAGWNEYQKLEAYRTWAAQFDHAKYDIYAVLGQKGDHLTWGKPTRKGPIHLQSFSLRQVEALYLRVGNERIDVEVAIAHPISGSPIALEFQMSDSAPVSIPFTDAALATRWGKHLQQDWQQMQPQA
jgi:hypothetical protein